MNIMFSSKEHQLFYDQKVQELHPDVYLRALIYTVGICDDTRRHWDCFYDTHGRCIRPEVINDEWQTGSSAKLTRLAFQLYTDGIPMILSSNTTAEQGDLLKKCGQYSVSNIFCCEFAPFFVEALKIRYPEYLNSLRRIELYKSHLLYN